jgi:thiol-disulfide isomerase/thioredoxin
MYSAVLRTLCILAVASASACAPEFLRAQERIPAFAIVALDDSAQLITDQSLRGHLTLIDFWATWCPPCVEEIPWLDSAYREFKDTNFRILSLSFDKAAEPVRHFRAKRFPMPWWHAVVERGFGSYLAKLFGVDNIPRQLLVDEDGVIVASDEELRGERLRETVLQHLRSEPRGR